METQSSWLALIKVCALISVGLMAGLFFAFSASVMRALGKMPPKDAILAMQLINVEIVNPVFLIVLVGSVIACLLTIVGSLSRLSDPSTGYAVAGSVIYLIGSILVTAIFNIPRNNALSTLNPLAPTSPSAWVSYLNEWTQWNHVRGIAATIGSLLLAIGLK